MGGGHLIYGMAEALAETGLAVFAVHYFDAIPRANRAGVTRYFERDEIIGDAIDYVSSCISLITSELAFSAILWGLSRR